MKKGIGIVRQLPRRQIIGITALGLAAIIALLLIFSLIGLFSVRVIEEQQATNSQVMRIVPEMRGYRVYWTGSTELQDITAYDVQIRELPDGGWRDWKRQTTATSAWFGPVEGKDFAFRVRAYDSTGRVEPWSGTASMTTEEVRQRSNGSGFDHTRWVIHTHYAIPCRKDLPVTPRQFNRINEKVRY